jgi:hypothetical protein
VTAVALRDGDDAPLAHLALLLAPCVVLTRDRHLTDEGIGQSDWLNTLLILKRLAELDAMIWGGSQFVAVCLYLPWLAISGLGRQLMRFELALAAVIGIGIGSALFLRPQLRSAAVAAWARVGPGLERLMEVGAEEFERRAEAEEALRPRLGSSWSDGSRCRARKSTANSSSPATTSRSPLRAQCCATTPASWASPVRAFSSGAASLDD